MNENQRKNLFPIISFFEAKASDELNYENGKIRIIPEKTLESTFSGKNIEVAFVLPSEEINVKCLAYKKEKYYFLDQIKSNPNPERIKAPCVHFENCGGCLFQHMNLNLYEKTKLKMLEKIFIDAGLENEIEKISKMNIIGPNLRRKANFESLKKNGEIFLGFHRFGSRQIIDINSCQIMDPEISALLLPLKRLLLKILNDFEKCEFFIVKAENGIDVGFEIHGQKILPNGADEEILKFCEENQGVIRFTFGSPKNLKIIYQKIDSGLPFLKFGDFDVKIHSNSFMQSSKQAELEIISAIKDFFPENSKELHLVDLFCGRGTYALNFVHDFLSIYGFELDEGALKDFGEAFISHGDEEIKKKIKLFKQNLFEEEFFENFFRENQFVIINPPRAGAEKVCQQIANSQNKPKNLVYVSCGPKTFARDAKILLNSGFKIKKIKPIDQFIWSAHLELVVHFEM